MKATLLRHALMAALLAVAVPAFADHAAPAAAGEVHAGTLVLTAGFQPGDAARRPGRRGLPDHHQRGLRG